MAYLAIVGLSVLAAVTYGVVHDQITVRICREYFTVFHPPLVASESPTVIALAWGVVASWWLGLILGIPLAFAARAGRRPKRRVKSLVRPIGILLLLAGFCALLSGVVGAFLAAGGAVTLTEPLASKIPAGKHPAFVAAFAAHASSYLIGAAGGTMLILLVWRSRAYGAGKKFVRA